MISGRSSARRVCFAAIVAWLVTGQPSSSDVVILADGTVVECKIREIKYPDPKLPARFIVIAQVDEKGTIRTIKSDDIKEDASGANRKAIFRAKTRWEKRAEFLKEYAAKRIPAAKQTWESQQQLGKWCRSHFLPEEGAAHYRKAHELRVAELREGLAAGKVKPESEIDQRVRIAGWCAKELGLLEEAAAELAAAYELRKASAGDAGHADTHYRLGQWCASVGLPDEALKEYEEAAAINPRHADAKAAIARIAASAEFKLRQFGAEYEASGRAVRLRVAVEDPADRKYLEAWAQKIQDLSEYLFALTEGQLFIASVEVEDNTGDGTIIVEKGKMNWRGVSNPEGVGVVAFCVGTGAPGWQVHAAGRNGVSVLAHELCHGIFGLPDEYFQDPMCDCVMRSAPNPQKLCDSATHVAGKPLPGSTAAEHAGCWEVIRGRKEFNGTMAHPNPGWAWLGSGAQKQPKGVADSAEGTRSGGGELTYRGLKFRAPPQTLVRIIDN